MAETIHFEASASNDTKFLFAVALCIQTMAHKRFARRDVAIWFYPPAADNAPPPYPNMFLNLSKHRWIRFFYPLVEGGRTGNKGEVWVFVHPIKGRTKAGFDLVETFLPLPEPDGVNVRVTD